MEIANINFIKDTTRIQIFWDMMLQHLANWLLVLWGDYCLHIQVSGSPTLFYGCSVIEHRRSKIFQNMSNSLTINRAS